MEIRRSAISGIRRNSNIPRVFARIVLFSSMTHRAVRELVWDGAFVGRLNIALRMTMALQAPLHKQRVFSPRNWHLIDRSMTSRTLDASIHMNAVIEINEIRKIVDARPLQGSILAIACTDRFQRRTVGPYLRVAIHARLSRRNTGEGTIFN